MGWNPASSIHVRSGGAWGAAGLDWHHPQSPEQAPGLGFLEIIPRNIPIPGVQIIPASTCLGDTNPIHLEPWEFFCFRPIYSRTCGEGMETSLDFCGFKGFILSSMGMAQLIWGISLEFQHIPAVARGQPHPCHSQLWDLGMGFSTRTWSR